MRIFVSILGGLLLLVFAIALLVLIAYGGPQIDANEGTFARILATYLQPLALFLLSIYAVGLIGRGLRARFMTPPAAAEYTALVQRAREHAKNDPSGYRRRLLALATLGAAWPLVVSVSLTAAAGALLAAGIVLEGGTMYVVLGAVVGMVALFVVGSLSSAGEAQPGLPLLPHDAPLLFDEIERLARQLDVRTGLRVVLSPEHNAAAGPDSSMLLPGRGNTYLQLGLPLLQSTRPHEFRAILAHELGHLSARQPRLERFVHRVVSTWAQFEAERMEEGRSGALLGQFSQWFVPVLTAHSTPLESHHERVADTISAESAGGRMAAAALANSIVRGNVLEEQAWPRIMDTVIDEPHPPRAPYSVLLDRTLRAAVPVEQALEWVHADQANLDSNDTHDCFPDRLRSFGLENDDDFVERLVAEVSEPIGESAADRFLAQATWRLANEIDQGWLTAVADDWEERHAFARRVRPRLEQLQTSRATGDIGDEELLQLAHLTWELFPDGRSDDLYQEALERNPQAPLPRFALGRTLLKRGDERGVLLIDSAISLDASSTVPGCELVMRFFASRGRLAEAEQYRVRMQQRMHEEIDAHVRTDFRNDDVYLDPTLSKTQLECAAQIACEMPELLGLRVTRKQTKVLADVPLHVFCARWDDTWYRRHQGAEPSPADRLGMRLSHALYSYTGDLIVVALNDLDMPAGPKRDLEQAPAHELVSGG